MEYFSLRIRDVKFEEKKSTLYLVKIKEKKNIIDHHILRL